MNEHERELWMRVVAAEISKGSSQTGALLAACQIVYTARKFSSKVNEQLAEQLGLTNDIFQIVEEAIGRDHLSYYKGIENGKTRACESHTCNECSSIQDGTSIVCADCCHNENDHSLPCYFTLKRKYSMT